MAIVLRNVTISPVDKETMLCINLDEFEAGSTSVTIFGKPYRWDLSISARSPQFLPKLPGYWQDNVLVNLDTLAGVAHREGVDEVKGGFQFSHGTTTYLMDLALTAEAGGLDPFPETETEKRKPGRPKKEIA
jgi:hypothetical protein